MVGMVESSGYERSETSNAAPAARRDWIAQGRIRLCFQPRKADFVPFGAGSVAMAGSALERGRVS